MVTLSANTAVALNAWSRVCMNWDTSVTPPVFSLYQNGNSVGSTPAPSSFNVAGVAAPSPLYAVQTGYPYWELGCKMDSQGSSGGFDGLLNNLQISTGSASLQAVNPLNSYSGSWKLDGSDSTSSGLQ